MFSATLRKRVQIFAPATHLFSATLRKWVQIFAVAMDVLGAMRWKGIQIFGIKRSGGHSVFGVASLFYEGLENRLASNGQDGGKEETDSNRQREVAANQILDGDASRAYEENAHGYNRPRQKKDGETDPQRVAVHSSPTVQEPPHALRDGPFWLHGGVKASGGIR